MRGETVSAMTDPRKGREDGRTDGRFYARGRLVVRIWGKGLMLEF